MLSIEDIKEKVAPIAEKYDISQMYLFGSYVRGEETEESDVDIVYDDRKSSIHSYFDKKNLRTDLENVLEHSVDCLPLSTLLESEGDDNYLIFTIYHEGVPIIEKKKTDSKGSAIV